MYDYTDMEVAVGIAKRMLAGWEREYIVEGKEDGEILISALIVAERALRRYKEGLEWRDPSA